MNGEAYLKRGATDYSTFRATITSKTGKTQP
jgi:hypothetical protein